ncbi:MAG TPA: hypothetical protein VF783_13910 [Terriglobales bacterium]
MTDDQHWAPARIWLQQGYGDEGTHTWCSHPTGEDLEEAEYVRVDPSPLCGKHCQNGYKDICHAAKYDGVVCADDECDIDSGIRSVPPPASTNKLTDEQIDRALAEWFDPANDPRDLEDLEARFRARFRAALAIIAATEAK